VRGARQGLTAQRFKTTDCDVPVHVRVDSLRRQLVPRLRNLQVRTTVCRRNGAPAQHAGRCQLTLCEYSLYVAALRDCA
jgi:hypothetical protein